MTVISRDLSGLGNPLRDIRKEFDELIIPHRKALWRYCFGITGSPWDAEDLVQETLLKAFSSLSQLWQPINPKGFLFRIASNTWIDQCRRMKLKTDSLELTGEPAYQEQLGLDVNEAIEKLVVHLPPRQRVVILLIDVFQFKSQEAAQMLGTSEGAVKALLNRARAKVRGLQKGNEEEENLQISEEHKKLINLYIESFNRRDPDGIAKLLDDNVNHDIVHIAKEYGKETVRKYSLTDWAKDPVQMEAELQFLWGRPAIIQLTKFEDSIAVYDVCLMVIELGKIIELKDFYFCPELLEAAAKELSLRAYPREYVF